MLLLAAVAFFLDLTMMIGILIIMIMTVRQSGKFRREIGLEATEKPRITTTSCDEEVV